MAIEFKNRFEWAVKTLVLKKTSTVAEVGCGNGQAAGLVADALTTGSVYAIDRSSKAIATAKKNLGKNPKITFKKSLLKAGFGKKQFDIIFCFNVNIFWTQPEGKNSEFEALYEALKPQGRLFLFYQNPQKTQDPKLLQDLTKIFAQHGFKKTKTFACEDLNVRSFGIVFKKGRS